MYKLGCSRKIVALFVHGIVFIVVCVAPFVAVAQNSYADESYLFGRQYYVLRSGQAKMIVQADKVGLDPAFSYLLFDTGNASQTARKSQAFNYTASQQFFSSAVGVRMKNYTFQALPGNCYTRWVVADGIPSAEARWWASGVKVREVITPLGSEGVFRRNITLVSADLVVRDTVYLTLSLPNELKQHKDNLFTNDLPDTRLGLKVTGDLPIKAIADNSVEFGPIVFSPGDSITVQSYLFVHVPKEDEDQFLAAAESLDRRAGLLAEQSKRQWSCSNTLTTEDELIRNMHDVSRYILPGYVADNGTMDAGVFEYGLQWVRDASNTALGLIHTGEFELARAAMAHMLKHMINDDGVTMISGGFDDPDREQFDQMGEYVHAMKAYVDWTGDTSLIRQYRHKLLAMIERPLHPNFRDETGMVHNRREFWERTFTDSYELAYQLWVTTGLRDAADLAVYLGVPEKADYWRKEAAMIQEAALTHPAARLVDQGHLIKRRNTDKTIETVFPYYGWVPGAPGTVETRSSIYPDATMALPVAMHFIDPQSDIAQNTIDELEALWNRRWSFGGYDRYNTSSQGDQPGPWTFATTFIMRAQHEAGRHDLSRRSLQWLYDVSGGHSGSWYEEIPLIKACSEKAGLLPWTSAEVSYFIIHHLLGVKFKGDSLTIKPNLYQTTAPICADLRYRNSRINLNVDGTGAVRYAVVNGQKQQPNAAGEIILPNDFEGGTIRIITK